MSRDAIDALVDGLATPDAAAIDAALAAIAEDPSAAARLRELLVIDEALSARFAAGRAGFADRVLGVLAERELVAADRPARRGGWTPALAAALVAAVLVILVRAPSAPVGAVASDAWVARGGERLRASAGGIALEVGDAIETVDAAGLCAWPDGTTLTLEAGSRVQVDRDAAMDRRVVLERGAVVASVAHLGPGRRFAVATGEAEARVLGTRFRVSRDGDGTVLAVESGRVELADLVAGSVRRVDAGGVATVAATPPGDGAARELDPCDRLDAWALGNGMRARVDADGWRGPALAFAYDFADKPWPWAMRMLEPAQDWRGWTGLRFRLRGLGDHRRFTVEVLDDLPPSPEPRDRYRSALRFSRALSDDHAGWTAIEVPFAALQRHGDQPDGAREHPLTLSDVVGVAFDPEPGAGELVIDELELYRR